MMIALIISVWKIRVFAFRVDNAVNPQNEGQMSTVMRCTFAAREDAREILIVQQEMKGATRVCAWRLPNANQVRVGILCRQSHRHTGRN